MTLTIELTPEQQAALEVEATAHGLDLPEFAKLRLLESAAFRKFGTDEEEAADELAWMGRFAASKNLLAKIAGEAAKERRTGLTAPLDSLVEE